MDHCIRPRGLPLRSTIGGVTQMLCLRDSQLLERKHGVDLGASANALRGIPVRAVPAHELICYPNP